MKQSKIFFCNSIEILANTLQESLYLKDNIFTEKWVIVSHHNMKNWLNLYFTEQKNISMNIKWVLWPEFYHHFVSRFAKNISLPSSLDLHLCLENHIFTLFSSYDQLSEGEKRIFSPLFQYFNFEKEQIIKKSFQRKLTYFCEELSAIFGLYSLYGKKLIENWEKQKIVHWQTHLFQEIFVNKGFSKAFENFSFSSFDTQPLQLYLFDIPFIPKSAHNFLENLTLSIEIAHYFLSPSMHYSQDICSDKERRFLHRHFKKTKVDTKKIDEMDQYLKDRNSLLANMGRMGKKNLQMLDDKAHIVDEYIYNEEEFFQWDVKNSKKNILLHSLQKDILFLRNSQIESFEREVDTSIVINQATSKLREVEILKGEILHLLAKQKTIKLSDISIPCSDIDAYAPYIHMVFADQIPYKISEISAFSSSSLLQGFLQILSLAFSRFEKKDLLGILQNPLIKEKFQFSHDEISIIENWLETTSMKWGMDETHFHEILEEKTVSSHHLEGSIKKIIYGLVFFLHEKDDLSAFHFPYPLEGLQSSLANVAHKFFYFMNHLMQDMKVLMKNPTFSLERWKQIFQKFFEGYFYILDEEKPFVSIINKWIEKLNHASKKNSNEMFSFTTLFHLFSKFIKKQTHLFHPHEVEALCFFPLKEGAITPSRVIYMLGMQEDFPNVQRANSLNLLTKEESSDYIPSSSEKIRFEFLRALILAKDFFYISYVYIDQAGKSQQPSLLVQELLSYMDEAYQSKGVPFSHLIMNQHPCNAFHEKYFQKQTKLKNSSSLYYQCAKAHYEQEKNIDPDVFFISSKNIEPKTNKFVLPSVISLSELSRFAAHPIRFFFQKVLGIYFDVQKKEDLELTVLDKLKLRKASFKHSLDPLLLSWQKRNFFPKKNMISEFFKAEVLEDICALHERLKHFALTSDDLFHVDMVLSCKEPYMDEKGNHIFPPIKVHLQDQELQIVGRLDSISKEGWFLDMQSKKADWIKIWPQYLIFSSLEMPFLKKQLLFGRDKKIHKLSFKNLEKTLRRYIEYFQEAHIEPSLFLPSFSEAFFAKDPDLLSQSILSAQKNLFFEDSYLEAALKDEKLFSKDQMIKKYAKKSFLEIFSPLSEERKGDI